MNKFFLIFFIFIFGCSLNSNSSFWSKAKKIETDDIVSTTLFADIKPNEKEFNPKLKIKLPISLAKNFNHKFNKDGFTSDQIFHENLSKYKFSKIENFSGFEPEILIDKENLYFFDNKGSIIKFNKN